MADSYDCCWHSGESFNARHGEVDDSATDLHAEEVLPHTEARKSAVVANSDDFDDSDEVAPRITRSMARRDRVSLWGIPVHRNSRPGLRKVEHVGTPPGSVVGWIKCDDCCQWVTTESGVANPPPAAPFTCKDNTWNTQLACCFFREEFKSFYVAWWVGTFNTPPVLCGTVCGKRLDFWYVYNIVTQLGGW